jgi:hypothetical protein
VKKENQNHRTEKKIDFCNNLFIFKDMKQIYLLLLFVFIISCDNEEQINLKKELTSNDWEQNTGIINDYITGPKQFYRISFKENNTAEIDLDYLGVSGDPDPVTLALIKTVYTLDLKENTITFPQPLDTLHGDGGLEIIVYLNKLKVLELKSGTLTTESVDTGLQGWVLGGGKLFFQQIK